MGKTQVWYHGTPFDFEAFDAVHLGKGNDQLGSGFYFTSNETTADGYALSEGHVLTAAIEMARPMPVNAKFSRSHIEAMLRASPDFEAAMTNWGEIGFEKEAVVVVRAIDSYAEMNKGCDDAVQVLNAISNDFWKGSEGAFLRAVHAATGFDGLVRKSGDETHAVAWFPEQVSIKDRRSVAAPAAQRI